jgi:hypothetical protein
MIDQALLSHFKAQADVLSLIYHKPTIVTFNEHAGVQVWIDREIPKDYEILYESEGE